MLISSNTTIKTHQNDIKLNGHLLDITCQSQLNIVRSALQRNKKKPSNYYMANENISKKKTPLIN